MLWITLNDLSYYRVYQDINPDDARNMLDKSHLQELLLRPIVVQLVCVILAIILMTQVTYYIFALSDIRHVDKLESPQPITINQLSQTEIQTDLKAHLFGEYLPKELSDLNIKRSMLDLQVVGILFATRMRDSNVIIRAENGQEATYHVGDTLPGGAIIKQISAGGIVVKHNGQLESLTLPKSELIFQPPPKPM